MSSSEPSKHGHSSDPPNSAPLETGSVRNPAHWVSEEDEQALKTLHQARMAALERRRLQGMVARGGSEERRNAEKHFRASLGREIRELDDAVERHERAQRSQLEMQRNYLDWEPLFRPKLGAVNPRPLSVDGEFWWASTDWFAAPGLGVSNQSDGLHFYGKIGYDADPLWKGGVGAVAHYALNADRRPPASRYASTPNVELYGTVTGYTFGRLAWEFDDRWCKCWLHLVQTAWQPTPGQPTVLASSHPPPWTVIFQENDGRWDQVPMPGFQPMPAIQFGLVDPNLPIWVDLEVHFDIQLEGKSGIHFSPEPNPFNSVLLRMPQWKIQPL
jgi:hypothetical protein